MINYSIYIGPKKPGTKKTAQGYATMAFGTAQVHDKLNFNDFCQHIADHNSPFSKGTVRGVLTDAVSCLKEQLLAGNSVQLGELGTFRVELSTEGAVTTEDFTSANIKGVNVCWLPGDNFKDMRREAEFQLVPSRKLAADAIEVIKNTDTIQGLE